MVWGIWLTTYMLAAYLYSIGIIVFMRDPINLNIYIGVFLAVLLACVFRGWQTRHKEFTAFALIFAINFTVGHLIWTYSGGYFESVAGHMLLHLALAAAVIAYTTSKTGAVVALLFVLDVIWGILGLTQVFPPRPWPIFTGFYYGDSIAYTGHLAMIVFGLSCGDGGKLARGWLNRGRYNENYGGLGSGGAGYGAGSHRRNTAVYTRPDSVTGHSSVRRDSSDTGTPDRSNQ
ncbi:MAG: hypothetical protein GY807_21120 [Gammaproteobacteria bacterium]|nr:hypothetical protein [Gammaproteobacteria bacterium]